MKVFNPQPRTPPVQIDRTQPIIIFDTWPFKKNCVALDFAPHYWWDGTALHLRDFTTAGTKGPGSALYHGDFLATATDGRTVFGKSVNMDKLP